MIKIEKQQFELLYGDNTAIIWGETKDGNEGPHLPWDDKNCKIYIHDKNGVVIKDNKILPFHVKR